MLARPSSRRLRSLWDEKCAILPRERRDRIKSALEEDYFLSPEYVEILYFNYLILGFEQDIKQPIEKDPTSP